MNSKERIKAAMDMRPHDKTPLMCQMSIGHMLTQLDDSPAEFWFDADVFANGLIKLREAYQFDGILVSLYGHDPNWREKISKIEKSAEMETVFFSNGDKAFFPYNDLPFYEFIEPRKEFIIEEFSIADLPIDVNYFPVSNGLPFYIHPDHKFDSIKRVIKEAGEEYSIHGEVTSPFDYYLDIMGHQNGLMGLIDDPEKVKMILEHFTSAVVKLAALMCSTGVDAIKISSPFAGSGFISPEDYAEFVFPFEKRVVQEIRSKNVRPYIHTCGAINDRLEMMFDTGASGIECLDPAPLGDVELIDAIERVGERGFIKGNIDSVNVLLNGERNEIIDDVIKRLEAGSNSNGFILSSACSIAPNVKKENIQLLRETLEKWTRK